MSQQPLAAIDPLLTELEAATDRLAVVRSEIGTAIHGQADMIDQTLIALLCGGHALLVGLPGLGKSRLVSTLGVVLGLDTKRVQFTPDLMPADILGSEVLDDTTSPRAFRFLPGPVFCQLLMADEINRASPRTQSALLQAMEERHVSIAGHDHALPTPFHVLATQNPLEQEGTYPLPEAQLDRFLLEISVGYPDAIAERRMLIATTTDTQPSLRPILGPRDLTNMQSAIRRMPVGDRIVDAILTLVRSARPDSATDDSIRRHVAWGPGPRAAQALMLATRARALMQGRLAPSHDDIAALARPVLRHRMNLSFGARSEGVSLDTLIDRLVGRLR